VLPKFDFNALHRYTSFVPILTYIFLRNCTKRLRSWHCALLSSMGAYTLETYLLQHHLWLSSNAKSLLVLIPGDVRRVLPRSAPYPHARLSLARASHLSLTLASHSVAQGYASYYANAALVTTLFLFVSKRAFVITLTLRSMLVPHGVRPVLQSVGAMLCAVLFAHTSAALLCSTRATAPMVTFVVVIFTIAGFTLVLHETSEEWHLQRLSKGIVLSVIGALAVAFIIFIGASTEADAEPEPAAIGVAPLSPSAVAAIHAHRMGHPQIGAILVFFAMLTLMTMDPLGGLARLFSRFTGAHYPGWEEAVAELHASFPLPVAQSSAGAKSP
jgi:hypothetical protein